MKKLLVSSFLIALITAGGSVYAQQPQFGIKGGVNVSNLVGGDWQQVKNSSLVGFHAGVFAGFLLGDHFSIQPEALLSSQGAKIEDAGKEENFRVLYATLPVMAKLRFTGGFYLEAGPQVGFKISESDVDNQTVKNFARNLDFSLAGGVGYHSPAGLGIGARYIQGVSKVKDLEGSDISDYPNFKNSVIQVSLFWSFFNNKK